MSKQRNPYWDIVKGFAILLVLLGHSIQCVKQGGTCYDDFLYRLIYSFHMPLFIFVSGYFFYPSLVKYGAMGNMFRKAETILIPLVCFGVVQMPFYYEAGDCTMVGITKLFLSCIGILWFLQLIIYCSIATTLIKTICKDNLLVFVLFTICTLFFPNVFGLDRFSFLFPIFALGYLLNKYGKIEFLLDVSSSKLFLFSTNFIVLFVFYNRDAFVYTTHTCITSSNLGIFQQTIIDYYRLIIGCSGSYMCLLWIKFLQRKLVGKQWAFLQQMGKISLGLYGFQTIFFRICSDNPFSRLNSLISIIIIFLLSLCFSLTLTYLVSKVKLFNKLFLGVR